MKTIQEVAKQAGISVRTLHHYDTIGLLKPTERTPAGYRLYDDTALARLQHILFLKELDFPLGQIAEILDDPTFDTHCAMQNHRKLLMMKKNRLNRLIRLVDQQLKGEQIMEFEAFDMREIDEARAQYQEEAQQRWGGTQAYRESEQRTKSYGKKDWERIKKEEQCIYNTFVGLMHKSPEHADVQAAVRSWQDYISRNFYQCTNEILAGLGELYVADERFQKNIDTHTPGLAQFMSDAIRVYCAKA